MKLKIISDGTNAGTHLIDEDAGEIIHRISKLTWEASADDVLTKTTVEFTNIPVEIVSKAKVDLLEFSPPDWKPVHTKSFEKEVKVITDPQKPGYSPFVKIYDIETNEAVGGIQKFKWEATPYERGATISKIKFDNTDWVKKDE